MMSQPSTPSKCEFQNPEDPPSGEQCLGYSSLPSLGREVERGGVQSGVVARWRQSGLAEELAPSFPEVILNS